MKSYAVKRTIFDSIMLAYIVGTVVVLSIISDEIQLLDMWSNFFVFLALAVVSGGASYALNLVGQETLGNLLFAPAHTKKNKSQVWYKTFWGWQLFVFFFLTLGVGLYATQASIYDLTDPDGFAGALRLAKGIASPNFAVLPMAIVNVIQTIFIAFVATVIAIPFAFVLSFFCAKNIMTHPVAFGVYVVLRTFLNITRSVEALIWAIIFTVWVGVGPFAGMLALLIHSMASLAKQYSEMIEVVSEGPIEGIASTGANKTQVVWFAIVPQVLLPFVSFTIYRWDINVRMATIIGLVGGGGIGTMLMKYQGQAMWPEVGAIIAVIAFVVWAMDTSSAYIREALK